MKLGESEFNQVIGEKNLLKLPGKLLWFALERFGHVHLEDIFRMCEQWAERLAIEINSIVDFPAILEHEISPENLCGDGYIQYEVFLSLMSKHKPQAVSVNACRQALLRAKYAFSIHMTDGEVPSGFIDMVSFVDCLLESCIDSTALCPPSSHALVNQLRSCMAVRNKKRNWEACIMDEEADEDSLDKLFVYHQAFTDCQVGLPLFLKIAEKFCTFPELFPCKTKVLFTEFVSTLRDVVGAPFGMAWRVARKLASPVVHRVESDSESEEVTKSHASLENADGADASPRTQLMEECELNSQQKLRVGKVAHVIADHLPNLPELEKKLINIESCEILMRDVFKRSISGLIDILRCKKVNLSLSADYIEVLTDIYAGTNPNAFMLAKYGASWADLASPKLLFSYCKLYIQYSIARGWVKNLNEPPTPDTKTGLIPALKLYFQDIFDSGLTFDPWQDALYGMLDVVQDSDCHVALKGCVEAVAVKVGMWVESQDLDFNINDPVQAMQSDGYLSCFEKEVADWVFCELSKAVCVNKRPSRAVGRRGLGDMPNATPYTRLPTRAQSAIKRKSYRDTMTARWTPSKVSRSRLNPANAMKMWVRHLGTLCPGNGLHVKVCFLRRVASCLASREA